MSLELESGHTLIDGGGAESGGHFFKKIGGDRFLKHESGGHFFHINQGGGQFFNVFKCLINGHSYILGGGHILSDRGG